jgi:hypothetical protein
LIFYFSLALETLMHLRFESLAIFVSISVFIPYYEDSGDNLKPVIIPIPL